MKMKNVYLITSSEFWLNGAGFWARTREMIHYLSKHVKLTVIALHAGSSQVDLILKNFGLPVSYFFLPEAVPPTRNNCIKLVADHVKEHGPAEVYIIDKAENWFILKALTSAGRKFVDTHDLISQRTKSARQYNAFSGLKLTEQQEMQLLQFFDGVICIQPDDHKLVSKWVGREKSILAPHPVQASPQSLKDNVRKIGFVASKWVANVDGLQWFIKEIWPSVYQSGLTLNVYGFIHQAFAKNQAQGVVFHGLVPDLARIYSNIDITINPVRWGAGLKIKTIEALANGLPLVTTPEGASGIASLDGKALLVAENKEAFAEKLKLLISDYPLRKSLGRAGCRWVKQNLSHDSCFRALLSAINKGQ
jgi:glycosyltransferase involved in cell wall biosynthesis